MYTPKSTRDGNASFTSASARAVASAAARRRSGVMTAVKRSPFATPGRSTPVNRSLQSSQILESSNQFTLEGYGAPLPALVMEALKFADRNVEMSAVLSPSGWAWLVCGRRLLIWRYRTDDTKSKSGNHQFRELTLPPSDLAHRSQLVVVYSAIDGQPPSCVTVSPEGFVRFWPSITHEGSYIEISTELQGQECDSLIFLGATVGCLLATTTSTTLLIQPTGGSSNNARQILIRHLKIPAGLLGGISRRVSSLVFGSMPTQAPEARLVRVLSINGKDDDRSVLVLSARSLQKWYLKPGEPDKLIYECNIEKYIHDGFVDHVWGHERVGGTQLQVWLIDMQLIQNTSAIMILTAAVNAQVSQQLVYALATLDVSSNVPTLSIANFSVLKHSEYYQESAESVFLAQRFLLCGGTAYIYNKDSVLCVSGEGDSGSDRVEFCGPSDFILGAGKSQGLPIFFSSEVGIMSITSPNQVNLNQSTLTLNESINVDESTRLNESLNVSIAHLENITSSSSHVTRLQAAFLHFNRNNLPQAHLLLDELFPIGDNAMLDSTVVQLSTNILNDVPATDPRWAESSQVSVSGGPMSLILLNQLKDKATAHQHFITFIHSTGFWTRLSTVTVEDRKIFTKQALAENSEKILFAIALRTNHQDHQTLVDAAIKFVLKDREEVPTGKLTHADIFYRKVEHIDSIVWGLSKAQDEVIAADIAPRDSPATIYSINSLLMTLFKAAKDYKTNKIPSVLKSNLGLQSDIQLEYVPWLSSTGPKGLRSLLITQHKTTVEAGLTRAEDGTTRSKLYCQIVELTDEILSGYQPHLQSLTGTSKHQSVLSDYEKDRFNLLQPLVKDSQFDQAIGLAEKYCDFRTLVEICDKTNNQERLNQYMTQFHSQGFSDFVFRWYLENGKRGKLLSYSGGDSGRQDLARFLQDYSSLAWLHQVNSRDFQAAQKTLRHLALDETAYLSRKKTLMSLGKLCKLASSEAEVVDEGQDLMLAEEDLILLQEQLPESVLNAHSLDADNMRVLSPTELIHLYIGEENTYANEYDFKKALDLLSYVEDSEESHILKKEIWTKAVKRNSWDNMDTDNPMDSLSDTIFFRTIDLAFTQGGDIKQLLISAEDLLDSEDLGDLKTDTTFNFFIQAGYEKIQQLC